MYSTLNLQHDIVTHNIHLAKGPSEESGTKKGICTYCTGTTTQVLSCHLRDTLSAVLLLWLNITEACTLQKKKRRRSKSTWHFLLFVTLHTCTPTQCVNIYAYMVILYIVFHTLHKLCIVTPPTKPSPTLVYQSSFPPPSLKTRQSQQYVYQTHSDKIIIIIIIKKIYR